MTVNPALFVEAPIFQSYLVDVATGLPMSSGVVTLYSDASHTILKNWYEQVLVGSTPTYVALPNPLTLSAVGTIVDGSGNNVQPLFYPYNEDDSTVIERYYITVDNSGGTRQFTVDYFPTNVAAAGGSSTSATTLTNLVSNNVFWRNAGTVDTSSVTSSSVPVILAPDNHDGFIYNGQYGGDWQFFKDASGATDGITFSQFAAGTPLDSSGATANPQYYMNFTCSVAGGDTYKIAQVPLQLHLRSLQLSNATLTFWARCNSGASSLGLKLLGYAGTGTSSSITTNLGTKNPPNVWTRYVVPFTFPTANPTIGTAGDDAWYLQFSYPAGGSAATSIDIALPTINMGNTYATTSAATYDQVDAIISSPKTGDIRQSFNILKSITTPTYYYGWVPCNDGTIGSSGSSATLVASTEAWPLYNLLWNGVTQTFAPVNGGRGASAYIDWNANKNMALPLMLGRALLGLPPTTSITYTHGSAPSWSSTTGYFTISGTLSEQLLYVGAPVFLTGTMPTGSSYVVNTIYYLAPRFDQQNASTFSKQFQLAASYADALSGLVIAGGGADDGASIVLNWLLGSQVGEPKHAQIANEVGPHSHTANRSTTSGGGPVTAWDVLTNSAITAADNIINTNTYLLPPANMTSGSQSTMNIVQPGTYVYTYLKL